MKKTFIMAHDLARRNALQAVQDAPAGYAVTISEPSRSLEQNALIHAELTEVGDAICWKFNGQPVDLDDLKSIFMAAYRKATGSAARFVIGADGQPVILNWRTRDLSKRECSEFVEMVRAWLAEYKAQFSQPERKS